MSTVDRKSHRNARRRARAEASAWVVRLHGPHRSPALEAGFREWLAADPEHARQFAQTFLRERAGPPAPPPRVAPAERLASVRRGVLGALRETAPPPPFDP